MGKMERLTSHAIEDSKFCDVFCLGQYDMVCGQPRAVGDRIVEGCDIDAGVLHAMLPQMGSKRRTTLDASSTVNKKWRIGSGR